MMKHRSLQLTLVLTAATVLIAISLTGAAAEIRVGVASTDITPPPGIPMAGYYHAHGANGVLDPLFAKALVIETGGRTRRAGHTRYYQYQPRHHRPGPR